MLIRPRSWFVDADHIFSHIHWKMRFYLADLGEEAYSPAEAAAASALEGAGMAAEAASVYEISAGDAQKSAGSGAAVSAGDTPVSSYRWIGKEDMETLPFPNLFLRILKQFWE